jgi:diadenosine tetraphosphatase ApaH/serine/threonine PP2A family protein phosphatase
MRIGLLADLHANREAVEACVEALQALACRRWVVLGDLVGYGADPGWVVDWVREQVAAGAIAVLGNHDQAVIAGDVLSMSPAIGAVTAWTRSVLDAGQLEFLRTLPLQVVDEDRLYVHANAWAPGEWAYVSNRLAAARSLLATPAWLTFCGHVHEPALYHLQAGAASHFVPTRGVAIPLSSQRHWLAIPGSCGQPRDGNPAAACAWFDIDSRQLGFLRVPYDHELSARKIRAAGLPPVFAQRLGEGR